MADEPEHTPAPEHGRGQHATRINETTTRQGIKLPLWAWVLVGGVAFGGGLLWWRARKAAQAQAAATGSAATTSGTQDPTTILPVFQGSQPNVGPSSTTGVTGNSWSPIYGVQGPPPTAPIYGGAQRIGPVYGSGGPIAVNLGSNPQQGVSLPINSGGASVPVNYYTVTGQGDTTPQGVASNISTNLPMESVALANLGYTTPYPTGTNLRIPGLV